MIQIFKAWFMDFWYVFISAFFDWNFRRLIESLRTYFKDAQQVQWKVIKFKKDLLGFDSATNDQVHLRDNGKAGSFDHE